MTHTSRPRAVVTGASSGIGAAFAERLAREGFDLVIVARRRDRLEQLQQHLQGDHGVSVEVRQVNLADPDGLRGLEREVGDDAALEMLVNNAGFGAYMPFIQLDRATADELIGVQVIAVTRLTRAALPGMIARGRGTIINVSSRLAFSATIPAPPLPHRATYAATKAYVNVFTELLHHELHGTGVRVQALCPGVVTTEFHGRMGMERPGGADMHLSPEDVVAASLAGLRLGEVICIPALMDTDLLITYQDAQQQLLRGSPGREVAPRYRD